MQVVDEMQEEEVEEMLEEVEEMQVVAIRQSSRRRCGQVVLSLRPRHLPNSLRSQCRCKTSFQCNNFLVLKFGFCGINTSTRPFIWFPNGDQTLTIQQEVHHCKVSTHGQVVEGGEP